MPRNFERALRRADLLVMGTDSEVQRDLAHLFARVSAA